MQMNSMAIIFQLIARCYQDPLVAKTTLVTAATFTLKALNQYLEKVPRLQRCFLAVLVYSSHCCVFDML